MKYYTGIGSRETPINILKDMSIIAKYLEKKGFIVRTGDAKGADQTFRNSVINKEVYNVSHANKECLIMASAIHPNWQACSDYAKKLHGRNCKQVLGDDLKTKSLFVVCWTKDGKLIGGTRTAIVLAQKNNIPVYNLAIQEDIKSLKNYLKSL